MPTHLVEEMFKASKELFDLPDDTKMKNLSSKPGHGYIGKIDVLPLYETFGIEDATTLEVAQAFAQLLWPNGNPGLCETVYSISSKVHNLQLLILKMVMDSYGAEKYCNSFTECNYTLFRLMKYNTPQSNAVEMALQPHVDKSTLTVLCQDSVQGLKVLSKEGEWLGVAPLPGEALKAWSNARLHPAKQSDDEWRQTKVLIWIVLNS